MIDMVVGNITNYKYDNIRNYVESLDTCGFVGTKVMICYNVDFDTVEELVKRNYSIITFQKNEEEKRFEYNRNFNIVVERFLHMWYYLKSLHNRGNYRYIITTDVKDVVFQSNPSSTLPGIIKDKKLNVSCESIKYCHEPWGQNNITKAFGAHLYGHLKDNLIFNAGVLAGEFDTMLDLFLNIYLISNGASSHHIEGGGGPDQAALNIILNMKPWRDITNFSMSEDGWAAQLGTTGPQVLNQFGNALVEPAPIIEDGLVYTRRGGKFTIVHQYDRVPELNKNES